MANQALASSRAEQSCHKQSTDTSDQCRQDTFKSSQMEPENSQVHQSSEMAVVLYNEDSILPLHKTDRSFHFVNRDIKIKQNWSALGVAAVVWDAVCI